MTADPDPSEATFSYYFDLTRAYGKPEDANEAREIARSREPVAVEEHTVRARRADRHLEQLPALTFLHLRTQDRLHAIDELRPYGVVAGL